MDADAVLHPLRRGVQATITHLPALLDRVALVGEVVLVTHHLQREDGALLPPDYVGLLSLIDQEATLAAMVNHIEGTPWPGVGERRQVRRGRQLRRELRQLLDSVREAPGAVVEITWRNEVRATLVSRRALGRLQAVAAQHEVWDCLMATWRMVRAEVSSEEALRLVG